jgi:hypothetical protein
MTLQFHKISEGIIKFPDGTFGYRHDKAEMELAAMKPVEYSVNDLILSLLCAQSDKSIIGRIKLFKELFIIEREVFGELLFRWNCIPGDDTLKLIEFLNKSMDLNHLHKAVFKKVKDESAIKFHTPNKRYTIALDIYKTKAILRQEHAALSWKPLYSFFVKADEGNLGIYKKIINLEDCQFIPYKYGPYSFHVANKLDALISHGLIERQGKKNTRLEEFTLSSKGKFLIAEKYESLNSELVQKLKRYRKGLDQYTIDGILRHVYNYYPQFKIKSKIGDKYKAISWGKGKG